MGCLRPELYVKIGIVGEQESNEYEALPVWTGLHEAPAILANQFMVQLNTDAGEYFVHLGSAIPPVPNHVKGQATLMPVITVGRFVLSDKGIRALAKMLAATVATLDEGNSQ